jgi:hypothetical protein
MALTVADQDDDITEDDASFPLTFAPEVEEAIATVESRCRSHERTPFEMYLS